MSVCGRRTGRWTISLVSIGFLIAATEWNGVPSTRHDWLWPIAPDAFDNFVLQWTSGWDPSGIGQPRYHLTQYLLAIPMLAIGTLAGSKVALAAYLALIAGTSSFLARRIAERFRLDLVAESVLAGFFVVNPWAYDQLVAGHLSMLLASACVGILWVEFSRLRTSPWLPLAIFGASTQPQFFIIAFVTCAVHVRRPAARACLIYGFIAFLPTTIGILSHVRAVEATPFNLDWEMVQSLAPREAVLLRGYFAGYDQAFRGKMGTMASSIFVALASSAVLILRRRALRGTLATVLVLVAATGLKGPLVSPISLAFVALPAIGVYRELYDLIGLVVMLYAVGCAVTMHRFPATRWVAILGVISFAALWVKAPPTHYWIPAEAASTSISHVSPGRYALVPPFQPVSFEGRGSGIDPAFAFRKASYTPINTYLPHFPETSALVSYATSGDVAALASLGTSAIVCRTGFVDANGTANVLQRRTCAAGSIDVNARPLLAMQDVGHLCSVCENVGVGNLFFGDATGGVLRWFPTSPVTSSFAGVPAARRHSDADIDWIDARLAFERRADLGQSFGGVYTRSRRPLDVGTPQSVLANVRGRLIDQRDVAIAVETHGYRWVRLRTMGSVLRCEGECALALEGAPPDVARDAPNVTETAVAMRSVTPWLSTARLPKGRTPLLKLLVAYDPWWIALGGGRSYEHVRLDAAINGWLVPTRSEALEVTIVNLAALAQFAAEIVGVGAFGSCFWRAFSPRRPIEPPRRYS